MAISMENPMTFTPTPEQSAIVAAACESTSNLLVVARAGAAKTSTLILLAEALPSTDILCLAFNKAIAVEMTERLPANCEAKTLHALGFKAWQSFIGKRCKIEARKTFFLLKDLLADEKVSQDERDEIYENLSETLDMISAGKRAGWLPESHGTRARPLCDDADFYNSLPIEPTELQCELVEAVTIASYKQAQHGLIDFDDMILCPAISAVSWPSPSLTLVDEAQDLGSINHHMLKKIVKKNRLIAVGDPCQPLGTMITKVIKKGDRWNQPKLKQIPIEDIKVGDTVLGHNANGSFIYNRKVKGITRKTFEGNLVVVGPTKYTPNHHCYTRFASLANHWCVYLMKKGNAHRVGKSRMSYGDQGLGPQIRAKAEDADAMWILSTYETETDAFIAKAVIQTEFGLSDLCFVDANRPWLSSFWAEMETLDLESRAQACLAFYHREFDYPLWQRGDSIPAKRPFITRACNLLNGCDLLPFIGEKLTGKEDWKSFPVSYEPYSGDVISFTISDNQLYVADNIVTHNCQAIYGFRGAHVDSMDKLKTQFGMEEYRLTVSFRCGKAITANARWRAEDMQSPEWASEGRVEITSVWDANMLSDGDAIICRNNAPLFAMAIKLIKAGRLPEIAGRDIGAPLAKIMKKLGKDSLPREGALDSLAAWKKKELDKTRNGAQGLVHDKATCIAIILEQTKTLGEAQAYLKHLLDRPGRIKLMTGHKSKGLEFDNVFFLDQHLCNLDYGQDANIKYVIETRAKKYLAYVTSDGFMED